jgi:hypothetical protein
LCHQLALVLVMLPPLCLVMALVMVLPLCLPDRVLLLWLHQRARGSGLGLQLLYQPHHWAARWAHQKGPP